VNQEYYYFFSGLDPSEVHYSVSLTNLP